jgi:hypothetical protein
MDGAALFASTTYKNLGYVLEVLWLRGLEMIWIVRPFLLSNLVRTCHGLLGEGPKVEYYNKHACTRTTIHAAQ